MHKPFIFIGDIIEPEFKLPFNLTNNIQLKRAEPYQVHIINQRLKLFMDVANDLMFNVSMYDKQMVKQEEGATHLKKIADAKEWRYFVIEFDLSVKNYKEYYPTIDKDINIIDVSFLISKSQITLLWAFIHFIELDKGSFQVDGVLSNGNRPYNFYKELFPIHTTFKIITKNEIELIQENIKYLNELRKPSPYIFIYNAMIDYVDLFEIAKRLSLKIIGMVAVLESLLCTDDNSHGRNINKQLQGKLNLVNNLLKNPIQLKNYFKLPEDTKFKTVIENIYKYRNDIAHGNIVNFEKKLQVLNNHNNVHQFLNDLIRDILEFSAKHPTLIKDIKES